MHSNASSFKKGHNQIDMQPRGLKYRQSSSQQPTDNRMNKRFSEDFSKSQRTLHGNQTGSNRNIQLLN